MGWKNIKSHYQINHQVQVTEEGICIGSPYIHNIIVIGFDGVIKKRYDGSSNNNLAHYQRQFDDDPGTLLKLIQSEDQFSQSITVYTYEDAEILEKQCEKLGWPNVTHDGLMMYENTFSADKNTVIVWAKINAEAAIRNTKERIIETEQRLLELQDRLAKYESILQTLG